MIQRDKLLHFSISLLITLTDVTAFSITIPGWLVAVIAGVGKEVYDIKRTGFDWKDIAADGAGIVAGLVIRLLFHLIIKP